MILNSHSFVIHFYQFTVYFLYVIFLCVRACERACVRACVRA